MSSDDAGKDERLKRGSGQVQLLLARLLVAEKERTAQTTTLMSVSGG